MTNFLVIPNLYKGNALTEVSKGLFRDIKKMSLNVKLIKFKQKIIILENGKLDNPEIFYKHSIEVLNQLKSKVKTDDKILFVDLFQLGLALINYYFEGTNKKIKYGGLMHGASFIKRDFYEKNTWLEHFERGMINLMDVVYVPSKYYANFFKNEEIGYKIKIMPFGFYPDNIPCNISSKKDIDVVIPHRFKWDKLPEFYLDLIKSMPDIKFGLFGSVANEEDTELIRLYNQLIDLPNVVQIGIKTGNKSLEIMRRSKVVIGLRDSFGYAFREAMASGCIPVLRNKTCYPEFIPKKYLFGNLKDARKLIRKFVYNYPMDYIKPESYSFRDILEDFYGN